MYNCADQLPSVLVIQIEREMMSLKQRSITASPNEARMRPCSRPI